MLQQIQLTDYSTHRPGTPQQKIQLQKKRNIRRHHHLGLFAITMFAEIFGMFMVFAKIFFITEIFYAMSFFTGLVRVGIFLTNSIHLTNGINKLLWKYYCGLDLNLALLMCASIAYIMQNVFAYNKASTFQIPAIIIYPLILFFFNGNFNVMIFKADWKRWQVFLYKLIKYVCLLSYLSIGIYLLKDNANDEILLLWIFVTLQFYAELIGKMSEIDGTSSGYDELYVFKDQ